MQVCLDGRMHAEGSVVALGMFDGVHLGHQVLLQKARTMAVRLKVPLVVQTFSQHPLCLLDPEHCPPLLTTFEERVRLMEAAGVDILYAPPFTQAMRDMPPEEFAGRLVRQWKPKAVVIGYNYTFGSKGAGTPALFHALGDALGFSTHIVPDIRLHGISVSSTYIRSKLSEGFPDIARSFLGRPYGRGAEMIRREGEKLELRWKQDQKQPLPTGQYRCLLSDDEHCYPVLIKVLEGDRAVCCIPERLALTGAISIDFLAGEEAQKQRAKQAGKTSGKGDITRR